MADTDELLEAVERELAALEESVAHAERYIMAASWDLLEESIRDQRRLTHALQKAMDASASARPDGLTKSVLDRLRRIGATRDRHLAALAAHQDETGKQLSTLSHWKRAARKWLSGYASPRGTGGIDQTR